MKEKEQMSLDDFLGDDNGTFEKEEKNKTCTDVLEEFLGELDDESNENEEIFVEPQKINKPKKTTAKTKGVKETKEDEYSISGEEITKVIKPAIDEILQKSFQEELRKIMVSLDEKAVKTLTEICTTYAIPQIVKEVKEELQLTRHIIEVPNLPEYESEHPVHKCFEDVMTMLLAGFNVYMYGEAGTGKTQIAEDIAKAMNLEFYNLTSGDMVGVYGYNDLTGKFHETPFTKAFCNGGVLYISEFDSIDPSIALTLNTAIANGITTINDKTVKKHKNFYVLCDGNTRGNGADFNYSARTQLDGSTINRFLYQEVDYDRNIEMFLADRNEDLVDFVDNFRKECRKKEIPCLVTYRAIQGIRALESKFGKEKSIKVSLLKGMGKDDLKNLQNSLKNYPNNPYIEAFLNVEEA